MTDLNFTIEDAVNEPIKGYLPNSPEKLSLKLKLKELSSQIFDIPIIINGQEIRRLKDVEEAFLNPDKGFHRIDFLPGSDRLSAVLPVEGLNQSNQRIKSNFRIPKLQSY